MHDARFLSLVLLAACNGGSGSLPDCATTDIVLSEEQRFSSNGTARWSFSACVLAPDYAPLNGADLDLRLTGVVSEVEVMTIEDWIPEQGCSRDDPNLLLVGDPLVPYAGSQDVRVGSVLRIVTDDDRPVSLILGAPPYCFGTDPTLDRAPPRGECPLWSYRVAEGKRVTLELSATGTGTVPEVTLELQGDDGRRELWLQQAPNAADLSLPGRLEVTLGAAECSTTSECGEPIEQHRIGVEIDGSTTSIGSGGSVVVDDFYLLNASTTAAASDSCSATTTSSVVLSWPACNDAVQRVDDQLESVGYRSCAGDPFPSQYFVSDRPEACSATTYADFTAPCQRDEDCDGDSCDFYCTRPSVCARDGDCAAGDVCLCAGMYGEEGNGALDANTCVPSECESDADCGGLPCAVGYTGFWVGTLDGVFCHTAEDECTTASDCPSDNYCRYRRKETRWVCEGISIP